MLPLVFIQPGLSKLQTDLMPQTDTSVKTVVSLTGDPRVTSLNPTSATFLTWRSCEKKDGIDVHA